MIGKIIDWRGSSLEDLKAFPESACAVAGKQLRNIQHGIEPNDFKPINDWGAGVIEIRLDDNSKAYRVVYIAKFEDKIYVLHSFQKKSQRTSQKDVNIIKVRYKEVIHERRTKNDRQN
ncbi:type II toxin-antitoxin system RelE/ParE family toxin [Yersinia intermedia]|jgi:phage-related protein|uniref:type II toxin-antitoxin system RelE/ParE family toxin n=2 Tax=Yersinia TaxID=629 RepID=UPI0005E5FC8B|nr:type II toxin-antitoxin system RelE/ParE family toxin [Yersinia intermedia]MCB5322042.1 type II toxin-antitoxin system RelE/ParE family toxin [Yersinia intermedia]UNK22620.1 type II toxin-antitoxin system RelE/ParE family toxin [Yersinia intermedia]UZM70284.1 type II toxin-antitoxin system RelE/ParE family toxin [Yersinia intermedia]CNH35186.1 Phage-related protein [Yersinia intermedia]CQJ54674.1 Phage-related protein [Yersinia intermedia]